MRPALRSLLVLCALSLPACADYPRDAGGSLARAQADVIRVGLSHDPPFVDLAADTPTGIEVAWFQEFARTRGMRVEWVPGGHEQLMRDLIALRLHAVAGGHRADSPWTGVSWSVPFHAAGDTGLVERRFALPPSEHAWQLRIDRALRESPPPTNGAGR